MKIFHVYEPDHFEGLIKNNLLNEDSGLKVQHIFTLPNAKKFNELAAKGSALYELIQKERYPLYIDRLTGGVKYHPYSFDKELFKAYQALLGEWFLGVQLHELGNNRYNDWNYTQDQFGDDFTTCGENGDLSLLYSSGATEIQKIKDGTYRITVPAAQLVVFKI